MLYNLSNEPFLNFLLPLFELESSCETFPASRGSFPDVRLREKRDLPWIENDYIEHAPGLATEPLHVMFVTRDENKTFHSNSHSNKHRQTEITTVFLDTRLSKTKHPRKRFQNFRQSYMLSTDRIEIHQSQPA